MSTTSNAIIERLRNHQCHPDTYPKSRRAAVLICLTPGPSGDLSVLLTLRSSTLRSHPNEVALPGGNAQQELSNFIVHKLTKLWRLLGRADDTDESLIATAVYWAYYLDHLNIVVANELHLLVQRSWRRDWIIPVTAHIHHDTPSVCIAAPIDRDTDRVCDECRCCLCGKDEPWWSECCIHSTAFPLLVILQLQLPWRGMVRTNVATPFIRGAASTQCHQRTRVPCDWIHGSCPPTLCNDRNW